MNNDQKQLVFTPTQFVKSIAADIRVGLTDGIASPSFLQISPVSPQCQL
jgi:hypothetical protein